jgi:phenylacetic acid degradation operon negative regulatory protein
VIGVEAPGPLAAAEPLQPQDLVVTLLGTYLRPPRQATVWSGGMVVLLGELGFTAGAARVALTRLVRRGLLVRVREGRLVHYRLTARADRVLAEGDGRIFSIGAGIDTDRGGAAAGSWTVLWHQIPEERRLERSRLTRRLRFLGFGSAADSVWASPHDHAEEVGALLGELGVSGYASVFLAQPVTLGRSGALGDAAVIAERAWDLPALAARYAAFHAEFESLLAATVRERLTDEQAFQVRTRLIHLFRGFAPLDPELPQEPAELDAVRARAVETFRALYAGLAEGAERHFATVVEGRHREESPAR